MGENNRRMRKNEEMFVSCPPEVESLATPLLVRLKDHKNMVRKILMKGHPKVKWSQIFNNI